MTNTAQFKTSVPGKWILSGEHSVLRGFPAIALPHTGYRLELEYEPRDKGPIEVEPGSFQPVLTALLEQLDSRWRPDAADSTSARGGLLKLTSSIPVGAGFGSSAAVCVALADWYSWLHGIDKKHVFEMASRLEDHFHGKSSGLDIAVVSTGSPIFFRRGSAPEPLKLDTLPRFTFHDSFVRAPTQKCIAKVEAMIQKEPERAAIYDGKMGSCSEALAGLLDRYSQDLRERMQLGPLIARAMNETQECFYAWDLVPPEVAALEKKLRAEGALGVKLTGAGGGGFLVALWPEGAQ